MDIIVQSALLDQLVLVFLLKYMYGPAGQIKDSLHPEHKVKIYRRIVPVVPDQNIAGIRLHDCHIL